MSETDPPSAVCANCQCANVGRYCPACGQRQLSREQYSLRHLFGELLGNLLQWDSKLLRTLTLALRKPGELSALHLAGVRARYTSPVTLLLLVFFLFFVAPPLTDFTLPLDNHLRWGGWYAGLAQHWVDSLAVDVGGMVVLATRFAEVQNDIAKTLVLLHVPLFALALQLLHWRKGFYYVEHVVVASHALVTMMLTFFVVFLVLLLPTVEIYHALGHADVPESARRRVIMFGLNLPLVLMLALTLKHAYRQSWWWVLLKLPLAVLAFGFSHMLYRAVTFYVTLLLL